MAVHLLRRKKTEEPPPPPTRRLHWPKMSWPKMSWPKMSWPERKTVGDAGPKRQRRRAPWQRRPANPLSVALWAASWAALLILGLGMLLVSADANQANWFVHATLKTGTWLATPFHDVFRNADARHQLYQNWGLAAAVYFVAGRILAWLLQWPR